MKIIRIPENSISGSQDLLVSEALYKNTLQNAVWFSGDCCCSRGFRIQIIDEAYGAAVIENDCTSENITVEILPAPPEFEGPTRIPELRRLLEI